MSEGAGPIAPLFLPYIDQDVYFHDVDRLQDELEQERCRNSELKDGIDRIVHEPLGMVFVLSNLVILVLMILCDLLCIRAVESTLLNRRTV